MTSEIFVGVSGFSYPSWKGRFYPKDLASDNFLEYYSQHLNSVEINSSFYAMPNPASVESWNGKTSQGFCFAFKATRKITHIAKLTDEAVKASLDMSQILQKLGAKRGPILFQLPPFSRQDLKLLENFLSKTSAIPERVFEFRHKSWLGEDTFALLEKYDSGFCVAETEELEPVLKVTGDFAYFRLRKDVYEEEAVEKWAKEIKSTAKGAKKTYVYLRHDETGENAEFARKLRTWL